MLRKIILPAVLLIFAHQEFYGMKASISSSIKWETINNYVNVDKSNDKEESYPTLKWVWVFLDNVPFQYGSSKIWKHGEAYYGLSNGIGFFPSPLNFGWIKIGIIDVHINVINFILVGFKYFVARKYSGQEYSLWKNILYTIYYNSVITGIHLLSFNFLNCIKIKIISIGMTIGIYTDLIKNEERDDAWYHTCFYGCKNITDTCLDMSSAYLMLSPRIEINISGIINYFSWK